MIADFYSEIKFNQNMKNKIVKHKIFFKKMIRI